MKRERERERVIGKHRPSFERGEVVYGGTHKWFHEFNDAVRRMIGRPPPSYVDISIHVTNRPTPTFANKLISFFFLNFPQNPHLLSFIFHPYPSLVRLWCSSYYFNLQMLKFYIKPLTYRFMLRKFYRYRWTKTIVKIKKP